jgi:hypothetical protein
VGLSFGWWSYVSLDDFYRCRPRYTVVKKKVVIKDSVIHLRDGIVLRDIDKLKIVRPTIIVRGDRKEGGYRHDWPVSNRWDQTAWRRLDGGRSRFDARLSALRERRRDPGRSELTLELKGGSAGPTELRVRIENRRRMRELEGTGVAVRHAAPDRGRQGDVIARERGRRDAVSVRVEEPEHSATLKRLEDLRRRQIEKPRSMEDIRSSVRARLDAVRSGGPTARGREEKQLRRDRANGPSNSALGRAARHPSESATEEAVLRKVRERNRGREKERERSRQIERLREQLDLHRRPRDSRQAPDVLDESARDGTGRPDSSQSGGRRIRAKEVATRTDIGARIQQMRMAAGAPKDGGQPGSGISGSSSKARARGTDALGLKLRRGSLLERWQFPEQTSDMALEIEREGIGRSIGKASRASRRR